MKKKSPFTGSLLLPASPYSKMEIRIGNNPDYNKAKWKATFLTPGRSVSYSACYATPEMSPGLSGEELRADVKSCTLSQMLLSSLGRVATCLTSGELLNEKFRQEWVSAVQACVRLFTATGRGKCLYLKPATQLRRVSAELWCKFIFWHSQKDM